MLRETFQTCEFSDSPCKPWTWQWKLSLIYLAMYSWTREMVQLLLKLSSQMFQRISSTNFLKVQTFQRTLSFSILLYWALPNLLCHPMDSFS